MLEAAFLVAPLAAATVLAFLTRRTVDTVVLYLIATVTTVATPFLLFGYRHLATDGCNDGSAYYYTNATGAILIGTAAMVTYATTRSARTATRQRRLILSAVAAAVMATPLLIAFVTQAVVLGSTTLRGCISGLEVGDEALDDTWRWTGEATMLHGVVNGTLFTVLCVAPLAAATVLAFLTRRTVDTVVLYLIATVTTVSAITIMMTGWRAVIAGQCSVSTNYYTNMVPALLTGLTLLVVYATLTATGAATVPQRFALTAIAVAIILVPVTVAVVNEWDLRALTDTCHQEGIANWRTGSR